LRKDASFSEEKEAKRLLFLAAASMGVHEYPNVKLRKNKSLFASFSSEKEDSYLLCRLTMPVAHGQAFIRTQDIPRQAMLHVAQ
jgi:hypothetical protein